MTTTLFSALGRGGSRVLDARVLVLNKGFQLFPSSAAAKGRKDEKPTLEQVVFANVFKGEHW